MAMKKAARKTTVRKAAKKATRKVTKKVAKKVTKKVAKKAVKKAAKKVAKKAGRNAASLKADRARVSKLAPELAYVAKKFGVTETQVTAVIDKVGNMRDDVYAALKSFKARSKAADRAKVSRQPHEVALLAKKFNTTSDAVLAALATHGSSRKKIEAVLGGK